MERISKYKLERVVARLNRTLGQKEEAWHRLENGGAEQNPNVFVLDWAYGGVSLDRNCDLTTGTQPRDMGERSRGCDVILERGTKRELYNGIHALLQGISLGREPIR